MNKRARASAALLAALIGASIFGAAQPRPASAVQSVTTLVATAQFATPCCSSVLGNRFPQPFSGVAVGDLNGNGTKQIVAGFGNGSVYAFDSSLNVLPGWPRQTGGAILSTPTLADLYGDGREEILVTSADGYLYVWNLDGSALAGWPQRVSYGAYVSHGGFDTAWAGSVAVGDLFGDGRMEIVGATLDHFLYAWNADGSMLSGFPINLWDTAWTTPALVDLQHNGKLDIVVGSDSSGGSSEPYPAGGVVWAFPPTGCGSPNGSWNGGCNLPGWPNHISNVSWSAPVAADMQDRTNSQYSVIAGTGHNFPNTGNSLYSWWQNGYPSAGGWPQTTGAPNFGAVAVGSLTGSSQLQVVESSEDGKLYAWNADGTWVPGFCPANCPAGGALSDPIIAPVDNSGHNGVWVANGGYVYGYTNAGVATVAADMGGPTDAAPTVTDLGNGKLSLISTSTNGNNPSQWMVRIFAIPGNPATMPAGAWPTFRGNMQRSGTLAPSATVAALPANEVASTAFNVTWSLRAGSVPASKYTVLEQDNSGPWLLWTKTAATSGTFYGVRGHTYAFRVIAGDRASFDDAMTPAQTSTTVSNVAPKATTYAGVYGLTYFGQALPQSSPPISVPTWDWNIARGIAVIPGTTSGYTVDGWGALHQFGTAPYETTGSYWSGWDIVRDVALDTCDATGHSGWVLDGWGGLHAFGIAPDLNKEAYWKGWDIARKLAINPCVGGSHITGFVMDAYGGLHGIADSTSVIPLAPSGAPWWNGWDIARGVVLSGANQGYVLDGWGGVHAFGGAPAVTPSGYWSGWDIARGIALSPGQTGGGWVIDGWGGIHSFGSGSTQPPSVQTQIYTPGHSDVIYLVAS